MTERYVCADCKAEITEGPIPRGGYRPALLCDCATWVRVVRPDGTSFLGGIAHLEPEHGGPAEDPVVLEQQARML